MSEAKFTEGPWGLPDAGVRAMGSVTVSSGDAGRWTGLIAEVDAGNYARSKDEGLANARLIAAAPDLYAALRKALNYIENTESELGIILESGNAARAALAKAEGKSE